MVVVSRFLAFSGYNARADTSFKSPADVVRAIAHCNMQTCSGVSKQLELAFPISLPCEASTLVGAFEENINDAIITIDCSGDFGLVLLRQTREGRWTFMNSVSYPQGDTYGNLKVSTQNIDSSITKDIVVEHVIGMHGTGYLEDFFIVFRIVDGRLRAVLHVLEHYVRAGWSGVPDLDEQSTFVFDAPTSKQPGDIVERLVISAGDLPRISLEQGYGWNPSSKMYAPEGWTEIELHPRAQKPQ